MSFETRFLPAEVDVIAPDGSQIRLLSRTERGSMCHCTLPAGRTSRAVKHRNVEEIWYFTQGEGEVWCRQNGHEEVITIKPGMSLTIPTGTDFQFRNAGSAAFCFVLVTMPPWPGEDEAVPVEGKWQPR